MLKVCNGFLAFVSRGLAVNCFDFHANLSELLAYSFVVLLINGVNDTFLALYVL